MPVRGYVAGLVHFRNNRWRHRSQPQHKCKQTGERSTRMQDQLIHLLVDEKSDVWDLDFAINGSGTSSSKCEDFKTQT
jgi:hypothetical protein